MTQELDAANLPKGTRLDKYEIAYPLGFVRGFHCYAARAIAAGGFGAPVLLKCVPSTQERVFLFYRKQFTNTLRHPGIARFHGTGGERGVVYLVMELLRGTPLRDVFEDGPLPLPALLALAEGMMAPLVYAHEHVSPRTGTPRPSLHGALSLDTVLVGAKGAVALVDFECMRPDPDSDPGSNPLDFDVLSALTPEQLSGGQLDPATDVYSAGRLLYQMSTGVTPYGEHRKISLVKAILFTDVRPPRAIDPTFDPLLEAVLLRAMKRQPEERYPSIREMALALAQLGTQRRVAADPRALAQRAARHEREFEREPS